MAAGRLSVYINSLLFARRQLTNQLFPAVASRSFLSDIPTSNHFPSSSPSTRTWSSQTLSPNPKKHNAKISIGPKTQTLQNNNQDSEFIYHGPISSTIKKVKLLSLSTCCLSVSLGPVITFMTSPAMNVVLKGAVASTVIFLSATTTAALHWFVAPYVHKLRWRPGSDSFEVETMTWLATEAHRTIQFAGVRPPRTRRPFVSFEADGKFYFVDAEHCANKALLARLTPTERARESAFKNL